MTENHTELTDLDIQRMTTSVVDQAKAALASGDTARAASLLDRATEQWHGLQTYSIEWVTSLLSFIAREQGEDAVERATREFGDEFVKPRRSEDWDQLPAPTRARAVASAMLANFGACEVGEDEEKIVLSFRCGTGGRLIDEGRYETEGGPYAVLHEPGPRTFMRDHLPVYCVHCPVNNEAQPVEWGRAPTTVEHPPTRPGEPCIHHIYKDPARMPQEVYVRIGKTPPGP